LLSVARDKSYWVAGDMKLEQGKKKRRDAGQKCKIIFAFLQVFITR